MVFLLASLCNTYVSSVLIPFEKLIYMTQLIWTCSKPYNIQFFFSFQGSGKRWEENVMSTFESIWYLHVSFMLSVYDILYDVYEIKIFGESAIQFYFIRKSMSTPLVRFLCIHFNGFIFLCSIIACLWQGGLITFIWHQRVEIVKWVPTQPPSGFEQ